MYTRIIFTLIIVLLLIIFAVQNADEVVIKIFGKEIHGSLSLFLILSILIGAVIGSILTLSIRKNADSRDKIKPAGKNKTDENVNN